MSTSAMWRAVSSLVVAMRPSRGLRPAPLAGRSPATRTAKPCHPGVAGRPVSGRPRSGLQPVAVATEVQRPQLLASLADQVALADQDLVGVPAQRLAFGAIAPAHDRAARPLRSERKILELQDFC